MLFLDSSSLCSYFRTFIIFLIQKYFMSYTFMDCRVNYLGMNKQKYSFSFTLTNSSNNTSFWPIFSCCTIQKVHCLLFEKKVVLLKSLLLTDLYCRNMASFAFSVKTNHLKILQSKSHTGISIR